MSFSARVPRSRSGWRLVEIFSMVREGQVGGLAPHGGMDVEPVLEECLHPGLSHTGSLHIFFVNAMCMILYQANKLLNRFGFSRNNIFIMYIGI
ncbi:hypothetical protein ZEAMMB73_Zm00001d020088 [Zea mays]|uniref:Uncharacterized protein n=1 Tax=Zea mays TaxID=4577 RepID=A0A1D6I228_MAIZE|nr:hypothetical protein ZEAMMB73_Zm00001d020088 [Zea mays]